MENDGTVPSEEGSRNMCDMRKPEAADRPSWFKSRSSGASGQGACVEVAWAADGVMVRDSKDRSGPVLLVAGECWDRFVEEVRSGA
jgi:Domain of unknown function (DUF397)